MNSVLYEEVQRHSGKLAETGRAHHLCPDFHGMIQIGFAMSILDFSQESGPATLTSRAQKGREAFLVTPCEMLRRGQLRLRNPAMEKVTIVLLGNGRIIENET